MGDHVFPGLTPTPPQHAVPAEFYCMLRSVSRVILVDDTDAQHSHLRAHGSPGDGVAMIHAPDDGRAWHDALLEIGLRCLNNRIGNLLEPAYQLCSTIRAEWFIWHRRRHPAGDPSLLLDPPGAHRA